MALRKDVFEGELVRSVSPDVVDNSRCRLKLAKGVKVTRSIQVSKSSCKNHDLHHEDTLQRSMVLPTRPNKADLGVNVVRRMAGWR